MVTHLWVLSLGNRPQKGPDRSLRWEGHGMLQEHTPWHSVGAKCLLFKTLQLADAHVVGLAGCAARRA